MEHGCSSNGGQCGCSTSSANSASSGAVRYETLNETPSSLPKVPDFVPVGDVATVTACVNGVALHANGLRPPERELRQRACTELLRQAAQREGLLSADDALSTDGVISETASQAIERLLERELQVPEPAHDDCLRYWEANQTRLSSAQRVQLRHILFAVTAGLDVRALMKRAEALLIELRCADDDGISFAKAARQWSNCPSGGDGGDLGWLQEQDCAPEFAREIFNSQIVGVYPRLVHSRFGLHIVEVCQRQSVALEDLDRIQSSVAQMLYQHTWKKALQQYLQLLAAQARIEGVALDTANSPLVQ